jgi:hypothetical protein
VRYNQEKQPSDDVIVDQFACPLDNLDSPVEEFDRCGRLREVPGALRAITLTLPVVIDALGASIPT